MPELFGDYRDIARWSVRVTVETLSRQRIVTQRETLKHAMIDLSTYLSQFPGNGNKLKILYIQLVDNRYGIQEQWADTIFPPRDSPFHTCNSR